MIDKIKKEKPYMRMQSSVSKSHPKKSDIIEEKEPIKTDEIKLSMKRSNTVQKKTKYDEAGDLNPLNMIKEDEDE